MAKKAKRLRRLPEDARNLILDAAETNLAGQSPAALRLQDVAREAGVSHPTILHHFGNREGLIQALNIRAMENLTRIVLAHMGQGESGEEGIARTFAAYREGVAQRLVWLLQSGALSNPGKLTFYDQVVDSLHALRKRLARPGHEPDIADTRHVVHLTTVAALGDALIGPRLRQAEGAGERQAGQAFEKFLTGLIDGFLESKA